MAEWSNEECLQLITLYEKHPVLWDPKNSFYFSKSKKLDAWDSIANELGMDVQIVRQKMSSLLGSFRQQKSKGKRAMGTGKGMYKKVSILHTVLLFIINKLFIFFN